MVRNYVRKTKDRWSSKMLETVLKRISDGKLNIQDALDKYPISRATIYRHLNKVEGENDSDAEGRKISTRDKGAKPKTRKKPSAPTPVRVPSKRSRSQTTKGQENGSDVESSASEDSISAESSGSLWSDDEEMEREGLKSAGDMAWKPHSTGQTKARKCATDEKRSLRGKSKKMKKEATPPPKSSSKSKTPAKKSRKRK